MGCLFSALATLVFWLALESEPGYLIPVTVFGCIGIVSLIVGLLGTDRAVARIWGSNN